MKHAISILFILAFNLAFASETVKGMGKDYEAFKQSMSKEISEIDKKIDRLKAESKEKGQETKENTIRELETARNKLKVELEEIKASSSDKWAQFKKGFAKSVDNLNDKVQKALKN